VTERLLLASVHDVSPRFEGEVDRLLDMLAPFAGSSIALLVVPNHWGEAPIVLGSAFAGRLRSWAENGMEIFLHGYFHRGDRPHEHARDRLRARFLTADEGEFLGLSRQVAGRRIEQGKALLEDVIGRPVNGFIAPAWLYGEGALEALADCGMSMAEDHFRVWSPVTGTVLARGPVITWASRTRVRLASSLIAAAALRYAPLNVFRIGVHPPDCRNRSILRSIEKSLKAATKSHRPSHYSDLLAPLSAAE